MPRTVDTLIETRRLIDWHGLHPGPHFATEAGFLHLAAAPFYAAETYLPRAFFTDEEASIRLIQCSAETMSALRWISAVLPTEPPTDPDTGAVDYLEHISHWLTEDDFFTGRRPNATDVLKVLDHAIQAAQNLTDIPAPRTAA
ncbi:hypothetical protein [Streptomyces olivaceiscleroticus]|uniref:Uncharacterized protein n=1 Tax=Streptomyces olivaceiscleroticus TaxID=68245 RepID=A0ABP3LKP7_9ACTN